MPTSEKSEIIDVQALNNADTRRRNWGRMHTIADRRLPFALGEGRERRRGAERIVVRSQQL